MSDSGTSLRLAAYALSLWGVDAVETRKLLAAGDDQPERVRCILAIHAQLRRLFPEQNDLAYRWPRTNNRAFGGQPPLDRMTAGLDGMRDVLEYVTAALGP